MTPSPWKPVDESSGPWKPVTEPGVLARFGHGLYETTVGPVLNTLAHPIDAAASAFNVPKLQEIAQHISAGDYGKAALAVGQYATDNPAKRMGDQMVGDVAHDVKEGNYAGAGGRILGDAAMLAGPKLGELAADTKIGSAVTAGAKAAAPDVATGGAMIAGGEAIAQVPGMSIPARIALGYPGAKQVGAGLKKGIAAGKAAYAERLTKAVNAAKEARAATDAANVPPDVMAELTRESEVPAPPPQAPQAAAQQPIPGQRLIGAPPQVTQMPAAPDASFVRSVPATYPEPSAPPPAQAPAAAATQAPPQEVPPGAAAPIHPNHAIKRTEMAQRFAKTLYNEGKGMTATDLRDLETGYTSQMMRDADVPYRWGDLADAMGEKMPSAGTVKEIIDRVAAMERQAKETPVVRENRTTEIAPKKASQMTRAELNAKQAGLPVNATRQQIMEAMKAEMEKAK